MSTKLLPKLSPRLSPRGRKRHSPASPSPGPSSSAVSSPSRVPPSSPSAKAGNNEPVARKKRKILRDDLQQVTKSSFIDTYRIDGMGYGGDCYYQSDFIPEIEANVWYDVLKSLDTYQPMLKLYGRTFPQSRLIAAYGTEPGMTLKYSGTEVSIHHPYPPVLQRMQERLEETLGVKFNHCMLNRYDDGSVMIGRHSDNLNNLVIASISLGAPRTFILSPRMPSKTAPKKRQVIKEVEEGLAKRKSIKFPLANGSLLVMQGRTQEFWKHEIPREPKVTKGRISLTFRQLV